MMKKCHLLILSLLSTSASIFADEPNIAPDQGFWQTFIMIGIAIVFFYFILWRPEQKRKKAMEELRSQMKKGDKVTAMGIVGTILKIQQDTVIVRMVDGAKIEFLKGAISEVIPATEEETKKLDREDKE